MGLNSELMDVDRGFALIASFPQFTTSHHPERGRSGRVRCVFFTREPSQQLP